MRQLGRNCRAIRYASLLQEEENAETLRPEQVWSQPKALACCVASTAGEWAVQAFGGYGDFSLVASITGDLCPLSVGDRVWVFTSVDSRHDYEVVRVARGLQNHLAALREVYSG